MQVSSDDVGSAIDDIYYPNKNGYVITNDWEHLSSMDVVNADTKDPEYLERFKGDLVDDRFTFVDSRKSVDGKSYIDDFRFNDIKEYTRNPNFHVKFNGWIGLGPYSKTDNTDRTDANLLYHLKSSNQIDYPIVSFYTNKADETQSHIAFGSWDPSLIKKQHLFMLRCRTKNNWEVESTAIKVGGLDLLSSKNDKRFIKFEPTQYQTYIPVDDFKAYQRALVKLYGSDIICDDDSCHFDTFCP